MNQTMDRKAKRIAVIGAGPGGLTAAMILAHRGFQVDVYETKDRPGGRNAHLQLGDYKFDVGPTFLMMKPLLDEVFQEAGADSEKQLDFVRLDPMYRLNFSDFSINCSSDLDKTRDEIRRVRPGHEAFFQRFFASEQKRFNLMLPCLKKHYSTLGTFFSKDLLRALPHLSLGKTVFQILRGYFKDDDLALSFSFQSKYLGMSAWECPGAFAMLAYIEYAFGVYHTQGGLSELSRTMAEVAKANGASILLNTPIKSLIIENRVARGVVLPDGEKRSYDDVIINADFGWAMENLIPEGVLRKYTPAKLKKKKYSCSTFMLYLGLDTIYNHLPHHAIFMAHQYRSNVEDIFQRGLLSEDLSFYVRNASVTDPSLAPQGHSALYVLVPVPNLRAPIQWGQETDAFRTRVIETIKKRCNIPDLESHIVQEQIITPENWRDDYFVYEGATFNMGHQLSQMLYLRPRNKFEEVDRCWLVGGGTHPGSGVPTILESGRITANMLTKKHRRS